MAIKLYITAIISFELICFLIYICHILKKKFCIKKIITPQSNPYPQVTKIETQIKQASTEPINKYEFQIVEKEKQNIWKSKPRQLK